VSDAAPSIQAEWDRLRNPLLIAGAVGLALCALGALLDPERFFQSWLVAFLFWLAMPLGSLAVLMLHQQTGGRWGLPLRRIQEAASQTLPLLALFFVPVALGVYYLYPWTDPGMFHGHERELLHKKEPYLNVPFFLIRAAVYFAVWLGVMARMYQWSRALERSWDPVVARRLQVFSGPVLVLYGLTVTFAAVDWIMTLEPFWYSSIFGALIAMAQLLPAFAFAIVVLTWLAPREPVPQALNPVIWNDLGNLLLTFVMLWSYMTFSQFFLIWSGNLPEEIVWYTRRIRGGWEFLGWALIVFYFALPFLALLVRDLKRTPQRLVCVAAAILVMHYVYTFWLVIPAFGIYGYGTHTPQFHIHWLDLAALVGQGGIWLAVFLWRLQARPLLALNDPALLEVEEAHHG
jgi:hypothetical protein